MDDDAAACEHEAGRDAQLVGEDGELVGLAVAVGVFADDDAVVALARRLQLVGVVDGDGDPEPAALVPVHADRLAAAGCSSGRTASTSKPFGSTMCFIDSSGGSGSCILLERLALTAARRVERDLLADVDVLERLDVLAQSSSSAGTGNGSSAIADGAARTAGSLADGPADAALDEVLKAGIAPGAFVVAPGGVEDAALALRPHPRPRLLLVALRRGIPGRCGPSRCAWCGRRSRPSSRSP